ncbi:YczE/YyaS/YitT family protein [Metabacillus arenae]|uniref:YitT family protein n=1 Tax=Metabacillus arenae TaxID=2771434 RepID=A0A926RZE7_9BACI|nr:hypothetical protein [Metabacillus arenae]MBD1382172.1 hypothetical protein [Metabacillus arenae]
MIIAVRGIFFFFGLVLYALGNAIAVKVQFLGLHPWEVLNVSLFERFGLTIGTWAVICGLFLILISLIVDRRYIHYGTFLNAILIGPIMDFFLWLDILPQATYTWLDYFILFCGIVITGVGGGMYVAAGMGAGPRDGFMLLISDKTRMSISRARILVESVVLFIGFLLGGPIFIVSFIYTLIQSPVFQYALKWLRRLLEIVKTGNKKKSAAL